jgi:hypothetical protein
MRAKLDAITRLCRLYTVPHTEVYEGHELRLVEQVVPWWPHWSTKCRKRPVYVRIEIECRALEEE